MNTKRCEKCSHPLEEPDDPVFQIQTQLRRYICETCESNFDIDGSDGGVTVLERDDRGAPL